MKLFLLKPSMLSLAFLGSSVCAVSLNYAATPLHLSKESFASRQALATNGTEVKELRRLVGPGNRLHVRVQQTFAGYPVYGAEAVIHLTNGNKKSSVTQLMSQRKATMGGLFYQGLHADLANVSVPFNKAQQSKALQHSKDLYLQNHKAVISQEKTQPIIFIDENNKAHYAYLTRFFAEPEANTFPEVPTYVLDASTLQLYQYWNDTREAIDPSLAHVTVTGGGFGGNEKTGQLDYDGSTPDLPSFLVTRDVATATCYMQNPFVKLKRNRNNNPDNVILNYPCAAPDPAHNNVFFSGNLINSNGSYSTANDPLATEKLTRRMFQDWYGLPVVAKDGQPVSVSMVINYSMLGAIYADGAGPVISMGDGAAGMFYPFTTRDIVSHELAHAFTAQYTKFGTMGEGAAVGESFSDMAAKALEYYLTGRNTWTFGADVMKNKSKSWRYMDLPTKDCEGRDPGQWCSIDHVSQYNGSVYKHFASGIFNRAFYTLSTTSGWDTKKAFDVMVSANMHYWTPASDFNDAACGVVNAAGDYGYNKNDVKAAFAVVGLDTSSC